MRSRLFSSLLGLLFIIGQTAPSYGAGDLENCAADAIHNQVSPEENLEQAKTITDATYAVADGLQVKLENCEGNAGCVRRALEPVREKAKKILEKTCMGEYPAALRAMMINLFVNESGWATTWLIEGHKNHEYKLKDFPIEYALANLILIPLMTERACEQTFRRRIKGDPPVGFRQLNRKYVMAAMAENIPTLAKAIAIVVPANFALDRIWRKEKKPVSSYVAKATLLTFEQSGPSNLFNVGVVNPLLKAHLEGISQVVSKSIFRGVIGPGKAAYVVGIPLAYGLKTFDFQFMVNGFMNKTQPELQEFLGGRTQCPPSDQACLSVEKFYDNHDYSSATSPNM